MAKDPAYLFYSDNFLSGTMFFSDEQVGKYIRLLCAQHLTGHLREKDMLTICKEKDERIFEKFVQDENGLYYNERLELEMSKRSKYTESRRTNRNQLNNEDLHIYFILNPDTGLVKIGSSVNYERRLIELKNQYKANLKLLFVSEKYPQKKETELHELFAHRQEFNEWYSLTKTDIEEIKSKHISVLTPKNTHMKNHMMHHMGNENEIENEDINTSSFDLFWQAYPKKKSKGQAEKAWSKINPSKQLLATMIAKIEQAKTSEDWLKDNGQYIPYPASWLNAKGWEDEYTSTGRIISNSSIGILSWAEQKERQYDEEGR